MHILVLVLIWKCVDLLVSIVAPFFISYLGFFSYAADMLQYDVPQFLRALTNFDGIFYIRIALNGYSLTEQAFFPVYPVLIRIVNGIVQQPIVSGVLISHAAFLVGVYMFYQYVSLMVSPEKRRWVLLFLLAYPTSYYFGVMYTESLFFMWIMGALLFAKKKRYLDAAMFGYMAALTRFIGVFLVVPLGILLFETYFKDRKQGVKKWIFNNWKMVILTFAPLLGLGTYCLYLYKTVGDPLFFFHAQEQFGANRTTHLITPFQVLYRYIKIFVTADMNFQYFVAVLEVVFYVGVIGLLSYDAWSLFKKKSRYFVDRLALNMFSWINILVPSLTGTLTSIPRYSLMSFSIFFVLAEIESVWLRKAILAFFMILHVIMFAFFIQGYFVT